MNDTEVKCKILNLIKEAESNFKRTGKAILDIENYVAEYLVANGVMAPPCKVGDTVYIIENRDMLNIDPSVCSVTDDEIYEMGYGRTQSGELKWLFLLLETGEDFYDDEVGKTVFLSKDEAEKVFSSKLLKGDKEDGKI